MYTLSKAAAKTIAKIATGLVFGIAVTSVVNAEVPKPANPMTIVSLPFDQRLAQIKERHAMLLKLTPQERQAYRQQRAQMRAAMSPAEKQALRDKVSANQAAMTPAQKAALKAENMAFINALPADEQAKIKNAKAKVKQSS
jgi:hypothetical protein